jgi:hypothetical protein
MIRRFKLGADPDGTPLVDRTGVVLGRITSISLDIPPESPLWSAEEGEPGDKGPRFTSLAKAEEEEKHPLPPTPTDPVSVVWAHYVEVMQPRRKEVSAEERAIIREALKVASVEECCNAISACSQSDFHMGRNSRSKGKKHNTLSLILKKRRASETSRAQTTRERIDWWLDKFEAPEPQHEFPSGERSKIWALQDWIRRLERDDERSQEAVEQLATDWGITTEWTVRKRSGHPDRAWPVFSIEVTRG